jgi:tRNA dimethylallyltransferase
MKENPQTLQNPQRMKRFVEVCLGTGKPYSFFLNQKKNQRPFTPIIIGLEADREIMYDRINQRVDFMINEGLEKETKGLFPNKQLNALQTVGYRELFDYFEGKITLDFAIEEIKKNTRRFSKRQLTWFKLTENVKWFDFKANKNDIVNYIKSQILIP